MKIVSVVGARPQFIKLEPVCRAIGAVQASGGAIEHVIVHTGQHYDLRMNDVFWDELKLPHVDHHLGVGSGRHGEQTAKMLERIEPVLMNATPDGVLVFGDTNSTLAAALAASKLHIPVAHVEAGLRSFDRRMPEEINRVITDQLSDLLFTPTATGSENLRAEGIPSSRIRQTGDVMWDILKRNLPRIAQRKAVLERFGLADASYALATIHRAANTDDPRRLRVIFDGLAKIHREFPVVVPLHPRTRNALDTLGILRRARDAMLVVEPQGYLDMLALERSARLIVTDSGGVQKEAFLLGVPCVTLREHTEWTETVNAGWNRLVPPLSARVIVEASMEMANRKPEPDTGHSCEVFGDGNAAAHIIEALIEIEAGSLDGGMDG
ncbi:UDP-N-acetylglucosamine 2-epimerase (non-hydrolyzing) [Candidatus Bipolaricaulota bacterium]|nr:UDP-N-acetylglucosamine 2-epimerase (non-hydrolyzing) [Candidatus Bipolaricaulota bacterium]